MNKRDAGRLAKRVERDDPRITVTGVQAWQTGPGRYVSYSLTCQDGRTGYTFTLRSAEDWEERKQAADLYQ